MHCCKTTHEGKVFPDEQFTHKRGEKTSCLASLTATQAMETARRHFNGREGLVFVAIDTSKLNMVWEPSRGGDLFPHLYDTLPVETAISITPMHPDADGTPVPVGGFPAS